jgi:hypothetical protein
VSLCSQIRPLSELQCGFAPKVSAVVTITKLLHCVTSLLDKCAARWFTSFFQAFFQRVPQTPKKVSVRATCYIRVHIRGSRPDPIQDESRLSRILGPDSHPHPSRRFPCPDNLTLISDSRSAVLWTSVDPVPDPLSGLVTFGVRSPFSTPHCI